MLVVPDKFVPYLRSPNISLFTQLQSLLTDNQQMTLSASIDWTESVTSEENGSLLNVVYERSNYSSSSSSSFSFASFSDADAAAALNDSSFELGTLQTLENSDTLPKKFTRDDSVERVRIWIEDRTVNELLDQFRWDFMWMEERIPMESPKLPQSTRAFLSTLCTNCYFLLRVTAKGTPHVQFDSDNSTIVLRK